MHFKDQIGKIITLNGKSNTSALNTGPLYGPFTAKHDYSHDTRFSPFTANMSIVVQSLFLLLPRTHISLGSGSLCIIVGNNIFFAKHLQG